MAYRFEREKTPSTPYILIDGEKRRMKLEGKSFHENAVAYFKEVTDWVDRLLVGDFADFTIDCRFEYFNSSTTKFLWNMFLDMNESGHADRITVNWIAARDNLLVSVAGEEFREDMDRLRFNLIKE